jgi:S1-C subfamily serine protease
MKTKKSVLAFAVLALALLACQASSLQTQQALPVPVSEPVLPVAPIDSNAANPATEQDGLVALYESVSPGTVAIITDQGQGSGFVYDGLGNVVTNYHVIEGATTVEVRFPSGYMAYGTIVGTDLDSDLAVIKVDAPSNELHPLPLGDSELLKVGQTVVAIGNPFGLNSTMTVGIVSALGRTLDSAHQASEGSFFTAGDIIQTDAAINPGNSGGPLFNTKGQVIGINRAIRTTNFSDTGEPVNSGIGFAISVNIVKRVVPVLIDAGKYDYPYLGLSSLPSENLNLPVVEALGLKSYLGAYVTDVVSGGPADKAGIIPGNKPTNIPNLSSGGDLIVAIDGQAVRTFDEMLAYLITSKGPGDSVVLQVLRGNEKVDVTVVLGSRP